MPTYDYRCGACGARIELYQSITEGPRRKCPKCGKQKLERQIGAGAGILFRGSGFYQTDYRSASYKEAAKKDSAAPSDSASKSESPSATDKASSSEPAKSTDSSKPKDTGSAPKKKKH
jgi:putative FmdB family regulatory protein